MGRKKYRTILVDEEVGKFIDSLVEDGFVEERGIGSWVTQAIFEKVQKDSTLVAEKKLMLSILQEKKVIATKEDAKYLIANEISLMRKSLGLKQGDFAKYLGVHERSVMRWEQMIGMPRTKMLKHIAFKCTGNINYFDDICEAQKLRVVGRKEYAEKKKKK